MRWVPLGCASLETTENVKKISILRLCSPPHAHPRLICASTCTLPSLRGAPRAIVQTPQDSSGPSKAETIVKHVLFEPRLCSRWTWRPNSLTGTRKRQSQFLDRHKEKAIAWLKTRVLGVSRAISSTSRRQRELEGLEASFGKAR